MVQVGGEAVRVCRFSPDSTLLATAGDNGQVCIWDLIHRNLIRQALLNNSMKIFKVWKLTPSPSHLLNSRFGYHGSYYFQVFPEARGRRAKPVFFARLELADHLVYVGRPKAVLHCRTDRHLYLQQSGHGRACLDR